MKIFQCGNCSHPLFFENAYCEKCGRTVGYNNTKMIMNTFPFSNGKLLSDRDQEHFRFCKNQEHKVCNWLIEAESPHEYCVACSLNRTTPDISDKTNHEKWQKLEVAKHRLVYQLQKIGLTVESKLTSDEGLCFDFLPRKNEGKAMTGHANGVITILLNEADSVLREQIRRDMSEPYRTLIGHFRHEVGHYYWDRLIATDAIVLERFRDAFGDEREDYGEALKTYYANGAPQNWRFNFISKYATSHPWEDWAESWAHYLHIMDTAETAYFYGLKVDPVRGFSGMDGTISFDPYEVESFSEIIETCIPVLFAVNSINRSMGIPDAYPFVVKNAVKNKMAFIHDLLMKVKREI